MRARQRHFNARDAGADLVLDARFIDQADNTAVSAWPDRSANNHTIQQTTSGSRPTFKLAQMNGNPVVQFDGSDDFLNGGDILDLGTNSLTMLAVVKRTSGNNGGLCGKSRFAAGGGRYALLRDNNSMLGIYDAAGSTGTAPVVASTSDTSTANRISLLQITRSTNVVIRFDGSQQASTNITASDTFNHNTTNEFFVGAYQSTTGTTPPQANYYWNGNIAQVVVLFASNTSLRKRLEHAAAYSFKIACN
jgi:hypothetical protein